MITGVGPGLDSARLDQLLTLYQHKSAWNVCALHKLKCLLVGKTPVGWLSLYGDCCRKITLITRLSDEGKL
jgi:hypothetical protein